MKNEITVLVPSIRYKVYIVFDLRPGHAVIPHSMLHVHALRKGPGTSTVDSRRRFDRGSSEFIKSSDDNQQLRC